MTHTKRTEKVAYNSEEWDAVKRAADLQGLSTEAFIRETSLRAADETVERMGFEVVHRSLPDEPWTVLRGPAA